MSVRNRFNYSRLNNDGDDSETNDEEDDLTSNLRPLVPRNLKIYICTWNVNTKQPHINISELLLFDTNNEPEICVFGFQEVNSKPLQRILDYFNNDPWTNELTNVLSQLDYVRLQSTRLVGNLLNVFVKRSLFPYVKCCSNDWLRLGFFGLWGNKGANIIGLSIGGFDMCFVNTHLSAHENMDKIRTNEYSKIINHSYKLSTNEQCINEQDYIFLFGDLNFRIEKMNINKVVELIEKKEYETLLQNDQLSRLMTKEKCFVSFEESDITFPPTYKFKCNTNVYDISRTNRVPSWCDRILYKTNQLSEDDPDVVKCKSNEYGSIVDLSLSDHKPVYSLIDINVLDWQIESQQVEFMEITPNDDENLDVYYRVNKSVVTHPKDWIGVYDPEFKHSKDYVTYINALRIVELENKMFDKRSIDSSKHTTKKYIQKNAIIYQHQLNPGYYTLGYFSYVANQIIGLSNPFELKIS